MQVTQSTRLKRYKFLTLVRVAGLIQANGHLVLYTSGTDDRGIQLNCFTNNRECIELALTVESFEEGTWYENTFVCDDSTGNPVQVRFFQLKPL